MEEPTQSLFRLSITEYAAWWGAIIATFTLLWNIYKWIKRGAKVIVRISPNMRQMGEGRTFIFVEVVNRGDLPTTITHLVGVYYPSILKRLLRKKHNYIYPYPGHGPAIPFMLNPGDRWTGSIDQAEAEKKFKGKGFFYCGVIHSTKKKPVFKRVDLKKLQSEA